MCRVKESQHSKRQTAKAFCRREKKQMLNPQKRRAECEQNPCVSQPRCFIPGVALTVWLRVRERTRFTWVVGRRDHSASSQGASELVRGSQPLPSPNQKEIPRWSERWVNLTFPPHAGVCFTFHSLRALLILSFYMRLCVIDASTHAPPRAPCVVLGKVDQANKGIKMTKTSLCHVSPRYILISTHFIPHSRTQKCFCCEIFDKLPKIYYIYTPLFQLQ